MYPKLQPSSVASVNTMISWYNDKQSNEGIHYENATSEGYHVLTLSYLVTGPLEIAVTFSNLVCNKTSSTQYTGKACIGCNHYPMFTDGTGQHFQ